MSTHVETRAVTTPPEASFGWDDFLHVLSVRAGLIRLVTLAVVGITALVLFSLPTLYSTSAVVMLDQRKNNVADQSSVLSALPTDTTSVQNQIQVLSSRDLALQVIDKLKLYSDGEFNPALSGSAPSLNPLSYLRGTQKPSGNARDNVVNAFLSRLDVSAQGISTTIEVRFTSTDPQKAARIANALAKTYTEDQVAIKVEASRKAAAWLSDRMQQLSGQLQAQEAAVEAYKTDNDLLDGGDGKSLVDQQLMAINTELVAAQSDLAEKRAAYERVNTLAKSGNANDVTPVVTSKMIGDLRQQEATLVREEADLATRYGPNHPRMEAIRNQKRDLAAKIAAEVAGIAGSMQSDLEVAKAHVGSIQASLAQVSKKARAENKARIKLNALEANLASTRSTYESFVSRLRAVQGQDDIQIPEARVISPAPVPAAPSSPHRALFLGASVPGGLLLGILLALLLERFGAAPAPRREPKPVLSEAVSSNPPGTGAPAYAVAPAPYPRTVPQMAAPPVLAEIAASPDLRLADWVMAHPDSPYGRALTGLLQQIMAPRPGVPAVAAPKAGRMIVFTAPIADPAKPVALLALARLAAGQGLRTMLIDGEEGRLVQGGPRQGLAVLLQGMGLEQAAVRDPGSTALVASAPPALWAAPQMPALIAHLKSRCDLILVDAPAPGRPGYWPAAASAADKVVLFTFATTSSFQRDAASRILHSMAAPLDGLVIAR